MTPEPGQQRIRVVVADDHDIVRAGILALLETMPGVTVAGEASNGRELVALLDSVSADVVLTDLAMPDMEGLAAIPAICAAHPAAKVLVLSMHDGVDVVRRAVSAGAAGYVVKSAAPSELEQAIRSVAAFGSYFSATVTERLLQPPAPAATDDLTPRQKEVITLIARGKSSKEIARELGLSPKTVDVHRARIMERLRLNDIAGLTRYAMSRRFVD
jgi:DNA-binding NarL/FixJ family response regulator